MIYLIFKLTVLTILTLAGNFASQMVGGFLYMLFSLTIRIPVIGKYMYNLLSGPVKLTTAIKLISWGISIGGIFWGIWIYGLIWGGSLSYYEHWVILIVAGVIIVNELYSVLFLNLYDPQDGLSFASQHFLPPEEVDIINQNPELKQKITFSNIIDMYIPLLMKQLTTMGVFYMSFYQLGFCTLKKTFAAPPTLWECVKYAYSFLPIVKVDNSDVAFEGFYWDICTITFGVIVFIWTTALLNFVLSSFMDNTKPKDGAETKIDVLNERLEATFQYFNQFFEELRDKLKGSNQPPRNTRRRKKPTDAPDKDQ